MYQVYNEDERTKAGFTITYRFDLYEHKKFINILKVIVIRHPKHIKKYEEWLKANTENKRVKKLLKKDKVAGEGFEPSTFGYPKSVYSI